MASMKYYGLMWKYINLLVFKKPTLGRLAEKMAAKRGSSTFLLFEEDRYTFDEFNRRANRRANLLRSMGVVKGDVVSLVMENRPEYLETLVGVSKLGAITAGINFNLRGRALIHSLKTAVGKKTIVGAECLPAFKEAMAQEQCVANEDVYVDTRWEADTQPPQGSHNLNELLEGAGEDNPPAVPLKSDDLFMYIYTSGTTGLPKAARVNHLRWVSAGIGMGWYGLGVSPRDTVYCALPLYHSNGVLIAFGSALVNGAALAISRRFSAGSFWPEVHHFGATCFIYIGEVLRYLVNTPPGPHDRDHKVTKILGNGLRPDIWDKFKERFGIAHIREFYSSTEGNAHTLNLDDVPGSVGKIILKSSDNLVLVRYDVDKEEHLRDENGFCQNCDPDEAGELLGKIKSTTPFGGYTSKEETDKKLLRNVFEKGDQFFRTGDLLKRDAEGNYYFIDRIGDTFRWKGENVSTHEVAEIIALYPGATFVNVYGVEIPGTEGRAGMASVTMDSGKTFDPKAFYEFTGEHLPVYAQPVFVRVKPEVELTGTFKMTKTELKSAGFDPGQVPDPLYLREAGQQTYVTLDKAAFDKINSGSVRI